MARLSAARVALLALAAAAVHAPAATAGQHTLAPDPAEARTFSTTHGGWSSTFDFGDYVCIPDVTCPSANPTHQPTGGASGAGDGYLRDSFGTLLGVLATTTINWTSPSFVAPPVVDAARLSVDLRPQIASLLAVGTVTYKAHLVDVADGTRSRQIADVPLTAASSAFAPVTATLPSGSVVPGRTYRLRLAVAQTSSVSAVTSGSVDLDNVVLTLSDLDLPIGLTATVPATGVLRVTGAVDPQGLDTDVVVDYGTTTAYGATTSAATIPGSATGAQPFAIPLSGLTGGTTYHHRVRATNADGTVESADGTFVAPSPPSSAAPTVSGAANVRARTVTFARAADVAAATVEAVDGGSSVVATADDADGDGEVELTLPDADGSYSVRVVRESDRGLRTTSATTPATLDRVAPSTAALGLDVTPGLSSATQRAISFTRPGDADVVTAQVIDAGDAPVGSAVPVTGGSANVTVGPADGAYRVRLRLTDAAGNSAEATSTAVTLDTAAPSAGPAPTVAGAANVRARTVTFTRAGDATTVAVELLDADDDPLGSIPVAAGGSTPLELPDADGAYGVRVRQTDAAGNSAQSPIAPVTLDRVAPSTAALGLSVTPALSAATQRAVSFTRPGDADVVTAQVIDAGDAPVGSAVPVTGGSANVTVGPADGAYRVRLRLTDAAGNSAEATSTAVTLDAAGPDAGPAPTVTGAVTDRARTITFTRASDATAVAVELLDSSDGLLDTIPVAAGSTTPLQLPDADGAYGVRVRQTDAAGNWAQSPIAPVTLDRVGPSVAALGLTVAPEISPETERTVSFTRPADADTVTAQVLDAADHPVGGAVTVTGGSGNVTVGPADGAYRVRLRLTDAAGNSSEATSTAVTLDTVAPEPGPAPTTEGDDPDALVVVFTRAPDTVSATVEVRDGSGAVVLTVPVTGGDRATVKLPATLGTYVVTVVQVDAAGNRTETPTTTVTRRAAGPSGPETPRAPEQPNAPVCTPATVVTGVAVRGGRVHVSGWTARPAGTALAVEVGAGTTVGRTTAGAGGRFTTAVRAPRGAAARNALAYRVVAGDTRSVAVKLRRANTLTKLVRSGETVTLHGRVDLARTGAVKLIEVVGRTGACAARSESLPIAGKAQVDRRTGRYTLRIRAAASDGPLIVRTRVTGARLASRSAFAVR